MRGSRAPDLSLATLWVASGPLWRTLQLTAAAAAFLLDVVDLWVCLSVSLCLSVCLYASVCVCCDAVAVKYNSCYAQPATSASIKSCNKTYHMEKELTSRGPDDDCRYASTSLVPSLSASVSLPLFIVSGRSAVDAYITVAYIIRSWSNKHFEHWRSVIIS